MVLQPKYLPTPGLEIKLESSLSRADYRELSPDNLAQVVSLRTPTEKVSGSNIRQDTHFLSKVFRGPHQSPQENFVTMHEIRKMPLSFQLEVHYHAVIPCFLKRR
jgi:hypothetical protein